MPAETLPDPAPALRAPTMRDVAALAGVSTATVSRALSRPESVSPETRAAVAAAVAEAGYTPNALARGLRTASAGSVLVLVPDIGNPYFADIIKGIEEAASAAGYGVLVGDTGRDPAREAKHAEILKARRADGVLLLDGRRLPLPPGGPPGIMVSDYDPSVPWPRIRIDHEAAAALATRHLLALGHRRIAHAAGPADLAITADRIAGWRRALSAEGLPAGRERVASAAFSIAGGMEAARRLLAVSPRPTALFCSSDEMAIGAIRVARQSGLTVPRDLSVVGFDDLQIAEAFEPALTTIRQPRRRMGREAMAMLLALIAGGPNRPETVLLPAELVVRASTAPPALSPDSEGSDP